MTILKSILLSCTIWLLTAFINTIVSGVWLSFFSNQSGIGTRVFFMVFICTLLFSLPGMFVFWIVLLVNWEQELLFRKLLKAAFLLSMLSSVILYILPADAIEGQSFFLSLWVVIASIASLMIHHSTIKTISINKQV